jgi:hypothetical protein
MSMTEQMTGYINRLWVAGDLDAVSQWCAGPAGQPASLPACQPVQLSKICALPGSSTAVAEVKSAKFERRV